MTRHNVEVWRELMSERCAGLVAAAEAMPMPDVASVSRLRAAWDAELVFAALELASARRKGEAKFGALIKSMAVDVEGVQMASSPAVAAWKAARVGERLSPVQHTGEGGVVLDLCCGLGGDSMELCRIAPVVAVDRDPARAWMAGFNARVASGTPRTGGPDRGAIHTATLDVAGLAEGGIVRLSDGRVLADEQIAAIHLDPARRDDAGHRERGLDRLEPGPKVITGLIKRFPNACVKLAPGLDASDFAQAGLLDAAGHGSDDGACELEYVSERGRLTQCVWWTGRLAGTSEATVLRRATLLDGEHAATLSRRGLVGIGSIADEPPVVEGGMLRRYVCTIDPAVERAGLLAALCEELGAAMAHPRVGLLTTDGPIVSPWVTNFEVLAEFAIGRGWSDRAKRDVKKWLADHNGGIAEVKTRGKLVDPDEVQRELRGKGSTTHTVFVLLFGERVRAIVGRRV